MFLFNANEMHLQRMREIQLGNHNLTYLKYIFNKDQKIRMDQYLILANQSNIISKM